MIWDYVNSLGKATIKLEDAMKIEALVKIAEQLEQLNKNLVAIKNSEMKVKVSGGINTHAY